MIYQESVQLLSDYYNRIDNTILKTLLAEYSRFKQCFPICRKGCDLCCHHLFFVSPIEGLVAFNYLLMKYQKTETLSNFMKRGPIISSRIERIMLNLFGEVVEDIEPDMDNKNFMLFSEAYNKENIPCIYLENGECLIYPLRPLACRFQSNFLNLSNCDAQQFKNQLERIEGVLSITSLKKDILSAIIDDILEIHKSFKLEYGNVTLVTCAYTILSDQFLNYFGET